MILTMVMEDPDMTLEHLIKCRRYMTKTVGLRKIITSKKHRHSCKLNIDKIMDCLRENDKEKAWHWKK